MIINTIFKYMMMTHFELKKMHRFKNVPIVVTLVVQAFMC